MTEPVFKSIRKAFHPELVILAVEDHTLFSKDIKHALPQHRVLFARTVEEAMQRYSDCLPDIIFLDLDLPDGNGFELLDYIRQREPDAYVVILTGSKLREDVDTAQQKSVQGYIIKPFTRAKIEQVIDQYLNMRESVIQSLLMETRKHRSEAIKDNQPN